MPAKSGKQILCEYLEESLVLDLTFLEVFENCFEKCGRKSNHTINEFLDYMAIVDSSPYSIREEVPKSNVFTSNIIPNLDEGRFKVIARMNWDNFNRLLELINNDPVFNGRGSSRQFPVYKQLMITLYRLGSYGEGGSIRKIAFLFGIGDGGTIDIVTRRVFTAILRLKDNFLRWPDPEEREQICRDTLHELPNCIGYIDGSEIKLAEKPLEDSESYFSRKHQYSLKIQAICDHKKKIRHLITGYPGSVHDARIYSNSDIGKNPELYFSGSQWLAGDSAYKLSMSLITPYRTTSKVGTPYERNLFNYIFGKYRIRIENVFGILQERFGSLKELRIRVGTDSSIRYATSWIYVCVIIHNIIDINDLEFDYDIEPECDTENFLSNTAVNDQAEEKRKAILQFIRSQSN